MVGYFGGKARLATRIVDSIIRVTGTAEVYEPFCGGCSVTEEFSKRGVRVKASDSNEYVIAMWQEAMNGRTMPYDVSRHEWEAAKTSEDKALKGFVGIGCSFGGKWFDGYAKNRRGDDYAFAASQGVSRKVKSMRGKASFAAMPYNEVRPEPGATVYCDPPYRDARSGYIHRFDWETFERFLATDWTDCNVFVSEYTSPGETFTELWSADTKVLVTSNASYNSDRTDKLYVRMAKR